MNNIELLSSPWDKSFFDLIGSVDTELLIASPFIGSYPIKRMAETFEKRRLNHKVKINVLTNLSVDNLLSGSLDISALRDFVELIPRTVVTYLPSLHAKVYVVDTKAAVITSANMTRGGLIGNHEYGILLRDYGLISQIREDLTKYSVMGNQVTVDTLSVLAQATQDLKSIRQEADKSIGSNLKAIFEQRVEDTRIELFRARARGKTTHGIFSETILYLIDKHGPLSTRDLHPLIQQIHPDLCDNTIELVIDSVHFGKKWKHDVRNSQVNLRRQGIIKLKDNIWHKLT